MGMTAPTNSNIVRLLIFVLLNVLVSQIIAISDGNAGQVARGGAGAVSKKRFNDDRIPCLFTNEESQYDRYAACLAATEGLRRMRDRAIAEEKQSSRKLDNDYRPDSETTPAQQYINEQYLLNSGKILNAMGMSISQFNDLGREISRNGKLRDKVLEQAYLYRMIASVNMDRMPLIENFHPTNSVEDIQRDKVQMFCESITEIEQLRAGQIERLKKALNVEKIPNNISISDPGLMPFLSPKVRAVVQAFPLQAEEIVKHHGLQSDEFNHMLKETKSNPMFRWKVQKKMKEVVPPTASPSPSSSSPYNEYSSKNAVPNKSYYRADQ